MKNTLYILVGFAVYGVSYGYELDQATSNMADELSRCSAYYSLMTHGFEKNGEDSEQLKKYGYLTYLMATELTNEKVTQARIELDMQMMSDEIDNNWSNGAILINKYGKHCKDIIEKPEERMQYWLDK